MKRRKARRFDEPVVIARGPFRPNVALIRKSFAKFYGTVEIRDAECQREVEPVDHFADHIPAGCSLERRPTRDDREEELAQLRTEDGRVLAAVERVDPSSLPN